MSSHLGAELAALVDGELDHAARERVLRHLVSCDGCRAEVEAQRRFKTEMRSWGEGAPSPDEALRARLRALSALEPAGAAPGPAGRRRPPAAPGPCRPSGRRRLRRRAVGGAVLALGIGAVLVLGGPAPTPTRTSIDPTSDALLLDYATTAGGLPLSEPVGVTSAGLGR